MKFKCTNTGFILFLVIFFIITHDIKAEEIPQEAIAIAENYLQNRINKFTSDPSLARIFGIKNIENITQAHLDTPFNCYNITYERLLNYNKKMNILSILDFVGYKFPVIIDKELQASVVVSAIKNKSKYSHIFQSIGCLEELMYKLRSECLPKDGYSISSLVIDNSYGYILILHEDGNKITACDDASATILSLNMTENGNYTIITLEDAIPYLRNYAEEASIAKEKAAKIMEKTRIPHEK